MNKWTKERKHEYHREYHKRWRENHRKMGLCMECNERAAPGKTKCQEHLDRQNERLRKNREERMAKGLCGKCLKKAVDGYSMCFRHLEEARKWKGSKRPPPDRSRGKRPPKRKGTLRKPVGPYEREYNMLMEHLDERMKDDHRLWRDWRSFTRQLFENRTMPTTVSTIEDVYRKMLNMLEPHLEDLGVDIGLAIKRQEGKQ